MPAEAPLPTPSLAALTAASLRVGLLGFGGPAGQIALMHRIFVEERRWIDEGRFMHALNFCMVLPGPEAQQLATYVGWLLRGPWGGVIAGLLFVLPGAAAVLGLSAFYVLHADASWAQGLLFGVRAAVLALIVDALARIGRRALLTPTDLALALAAAVALSLFGAPFPIVILAAAAIGAVRARSRAADATPRETNRTPVGHDGKGALAAAALWGALWLAPLAAVVLAFGPEHVLARVGVLFSTLAVVTFGGAYAALAHLQQEAVETYGWLSAPQMLDGLGLAEVTPGPLVLVNQFVGFIAGWSAAEGWGLAIAAAALASWCTFAPSFLWIFAGAPFAERLRTNARINAVLAAVTAAVVGVIASLGLDLASAALFGETVAVAAPWGRMLELPRLGAFDAFAAGLALLAALALLSRRIGPAAAIVACAGAGLTLDFTGLLD